MPFGVITRTQVERGMKPRAKKVFGKPSLTSKVTRIVRKNLAELKHFTTTLAAVGVFQGSNFNAVLTDVPQPLAGAPPTDQTRVGDQILITSLHLKIKLRAQRDLTIVDPGFLCRVILYQYKPNNGLLPPVLSRLLVNDQTATPNTCSHQNIDHQQNYHILYDSTKSCAQISGAAGAAYSTPDTFVRFWNFFVPHKVMAKKLQYDTGGIAHTNAIYLAVFSDTSAGGAIADPTIEFQARLRFMDL